MLFYLYFYFILTVGANARDGSTRCFYAFRFLNSHKNASNMSRLSLIHLHGGTHSNNFFSHSEKYAIKHYFANTYAH